MDKRLYPFLKYAAIIGTIAWVGWSLYDYLGSKAPGDFAYHAGSNYFADGHYDKALAEYETALRENPEHFAAKRGQAEALIMLKREQEAIATYEELLALKPEDAGYHANLGIAYDRVGEHEKALQHYEKALSLNPEVGAGPNWLTRFLRNQADKPPGIAERAAYLRAQLQLPKQERVLRMPEIDAAQRPYKE